MLMSTTPKCTNHITLLHIRLTRRSPMSAICPVLPTCCLSPRASMCLQCCVNLSTLVALNGLQQTHDRHFPAVPPVRGLWIDIHFHGLNSARIEGCQKLGVDTSSAHCLCGAEWMLDIYTVPVASERLTVQKASGTRRAAEKTSGKH